MILASDTIPMAGESSAPAPLRVAVVDDDPLQGRLLRDVLRLRGHEVTVFGDGEQALAAIVLERRPFDVVVSDLNMPGLAGDALGLTLASELGGLAPPLVIVSGDDDEEQVGRALDAGARHFVRKPVSPGELRAVVERLGRRPASRRAPTPVLPAEPRLGPYTLLGELGRGGMGVVHRARHDAGHEVALKVLRAPFADVEEQLRFRRELDILASLRHPGIAGLLESGASGGTVYYAMELAPGRTLEALIRAEGPLPWRRAAAFVAALARTLSYVHEAGVVHRDVKPANVVVDERDTLRLVDFGLARRPVDLALTQRDWILGTPLYLAPERLQGATGAGPAADVFSLGILLHELILGHHPLALEAQQADPFQLARRLLAGLPSLRELAPGVPAELADLGARAADVEPAERPSAAELALALDALLSPPTHQEFTP